MSLHLICEDRLEIGVIPLGSPAVRVKENNRLSRCPIFVNTYQKKVTITRISIQDPVIAMDFGDYIVFSIGGSISLMYSL